MQAPIIADSGWTTASRFMPKLLESGSIGVSIDKRVKFGVSSIGSFVGELLLDLGQLCGSIDPGFGEGVGFVGGGFHLGGLFLGEVDVIFVLELILAEFLDVLLSLRDE